MSVKEDLASLLKELRLPDIMKSYEDIAEYATKESLSYEEFLLEVVRSEASQKKSRRVEKLKKESRLPLGKGFESYDLKRLTSKLKQQVSILRQGDFLNKQENILAFGIPGSGKSHLLCAIGFEMIEKGKRVLFTTCDDLVQDLLISKRDLKFSRKQKALDKYHAVIVDDIGYVQRTREEMEVLFSFLAHRYERGSVMITSNLPFSKWDAIFKDKMTAAAAIDRLVHHSVILEMNLPSYRTEGKGGS